MRVTFTRQVKSSVESGEAVVPVQTTFDVSTPPKSISRDEIQDPNNEWGKVYNEFKSWEEVNPTDKITVRFKFPFDVSPEFVAEEQEGTSPLRNDPPADLQDRLHSWQIMLDTRYWLGTVGINPDEDGHYEVCVRKNTKREAGKHGEIAEFTYLLPSRNVAGRSAVEPDLWLRVDPLGDISRGTVCLPVTQLANIEFKYGGVELTKAINDRTGEIVPPDDYLRVPY